MKLVTLIIVLVGGMLVIGSYIHGLVTNPGKASALWGGVPRSLVPAYTLSMVLAAAGYLLFTYFLLFRAAHMGLEPDFRVLAVIYVFILVPSALWMPLVIQLVSRPDPVLWFAIRLVLALVGLAALAMVVFLIANAPHPRDWSYWAALVGSIVFLLHTAVLDAVLWPRAFSG